MPLKTVLFLGLFVVCTVGALYTPLLGVLGYVAHYCIGPDRQWWNAPIGHWGLRYSFTLAVATAIGMALHWRRLRFGKSLLTRHEWLIVLFLGVVWFSTLIGPETERYTIVDHPSVKFTKVAVFLFMLTHIITTQRNLDVLFWVLIVGGLVLGLQAFTTPYSAFQSGRLERVGGPDFSDANTLGGYLGGLLFIVAVQFIRSGWRGRLVCFLAGGFIANAIVLTRSRAAVMGVAAGALVAAILSPRKHRRKIILGLVLAGLGFLYLADPQFLERTSTITTDAEQMDASAVSRIDLAKAGMRMMVDHPLGVGVGNFYQSIGRYAPEYAGRDAHNTFVRCAGELGFPGLLVFLLIIASALITFYRVMRKTKAYETLDAHNLSLMAYGGMAALTAFLAYGLTHTITYAEFLWWWLALPACLTRVMENEAAEQNITPRLDNEETGRRAREWRKNLAAT
ncbi:MAG: O-antigen ligase family protein [Candidatus Hydrogenedentota bacterium]